MNSLLMVGCGLLVICLLIFLVVYFASEASENRKKAENAERNLDVIKSFQQGMSRPLARGNDLLDRLRSRLPKS